jgi:glycosyltransferase involved in cell wall biosynthesis
VVLGNLFRQLTSRQAKAERPRLSFIICSINDERFDAICANIARCVTGITYEVVRARNAKSLTAAYNRGIEMSRGELLVFCHDDIEIMQADFGQRLLADFEQYDVFGVAGTSRMVDGYWGTAGQPLLFGQVLQKNEDKDGYTLYMFDFHDKPMPQIQGLDGLFIAARREAAEQIGFDQERFDGFHLYDADFSFRAHLAGLRVGVSRWILLFHQSHGDKNAEWQRGMDRFQEKFRDVLPKDWEAGPAYTLNVSVADKAGALPAFMDIRGNPQRYLDQASQMWPDKA